MQIIIPMSGFGERFRKSGVKVPKPMIVVDGLPMICHVINMFPGETDFLFVCNQEHLDTSVFRIRETIEAYCPTGRVVGIAPHKLGPVHAITEVKELVELDRPTIVNYCDFSCYWDWKVFKEFVIISGCDGAIPAYRGFHPHSLGSTNYAYLLESFGAVKDIQEKRPFTADRISEYASSGTYYFSSARVMFDAFKSMLENNLEVNGEYYVSLAYKKLLEDGRSVSVYPLQHFMQWGTPEDLAEYESWSNLFHHLTKPKESRSIDLGSNIILAGGLGKRFLNEGYIDPKPLISVSGSPMILQAASTLPSARNHIFLIREKMSGVNELRCSIIDKYPNAVVREIPELTDGQACTALLGVETLESDNSMVSGSLAPVTIGSCDNGIIYNHRSLESLINRDDVDIIVWAARRHYAAIRNPNMFGWIDVAPSGRIKGVSVKKPLSSTAEDQVITGTFTFKRISDLKISISSLLKSDERINGEFYLDSCINHAIALGLRCYALTVDHYISWGTPDELRTFEYWQSCFHKWDWHPYRIEKDPMIQFGSTKSLEVRYSSTLPQLPK